MSSLAGALEPAFVTPKAEPITQPPLRLKEEDVEMKPVGGDRQANEDEGMDDLFGNDEEVERVHEPIDLASEEQSASEPEEEEDRQRKALEYEEEDIPPELAVEVREADVSFPNIPVPQSSDGDNWVIRMPNFMKMDSKPFHPDTYVGPEDEEPQQTDVREKSMSIKLKVENTVRWRWIKDHRGNDVRQSNSRIIRWSDGTLSLRLGKELFDIHKSVDTSGGVPRQSFGGPSGSQPASQILTSGGKSQGLMYLVAQHKRSQVLQAEAHIMGYMSLRPTGMQSETHRMLVRAVGQKHNKIARLRMTEDPTIDPEREKMELIKQSAKKARRKTADEDGLGGGGGGGGSGGKRKRRRRADTFSDEEDEGAYSDEDGSPRRAWQKRGRDEGGGADYEEDDFVVRDEGSGDEEESGRRRHRRKDDDEEEDPLDAIDAKIEARNKHEGVKNHEDEEMDVESEDEEEPKVRRAGGARAAPRKQIYEEDEDE